MENLAKASHELFTRAPDERFPSLRALWEHCQEDKKNGIEQWHPPSLVVPEPVNGCIGLRLDQEGSYALNDWSFTQLCRQAEVHKETVNQVSPDTATRILSETLPRGAKPLQIFTQRETVRAVHGVSYTRLYNADLLSVVQEFATDFRAPQEAVDGGTGLYCGEQDMFCFLIDPTGWAEIDGQAFAPGFFLWNSEVGRRSVGIQTFWFQAVCQNHIVWDAVEVTEFSRKHTANVHESLNEIRRLVEALVTKRDERRDGFAQLIKKAMSTHLGNDREELIMLLGQNGITRKLADEALVIANHNGVFTVFSVVDALTRLSQRSAYAGDRTEADHKAARLLALAA
jgi:hypothetical protein